MNWFRKYLWVAFTSARSNLAYLGEVLGRFLFLTVILYIFLRIWQETYSSSGLSKMGGLTIGQMLWYLTITEAIVLSAPKVSQLVDEDVRTGAFATYLVRPIFYPCYRLSTSFGERSVRFFGNLIAGALVTSFLVGLANLSIWNLLMLMLSLPLAFAIDFLGAFLVGLGAFWIEDTSGLFLIYSRGTMFLGGVLIPIELYPKAVQELITILPFASVAYGPARLFVNPSFNNLFSILTRQLSAALVLGIAVYLVYRIAARRIAINGG
jgi:ABC-2 type transport system permease protein